MAVKEVAEVFLSTLDIPARDDGRTPERDEGRTTPFDPERLGGRGSWSSSMLSMLAAERSPLLLGGRPRLVGRMSLMAGVWLGLEGEVGRAWSWLGSSTKQETC